MGMRRLRGPDGELYEVDEAEIAERGMLPGWSEDTGEATAANPFGYQETQEKIGDADSAALGFLDTATAGFLDEASGAVDTALGFIREGDFNPEVQDVLARYKQARDGHRQHIAAAAEEDPAAFNLAAGAGAFVPTSKLGTARTLKGMLGTGAAVGTAYGVGHSEQDPLSGGMAKDALRGSALGAAGGGVGFGVTRGIQKYAPAERLASGLENASKGSGRIAQGLRTMTGPMVSSLAGSAVGGALGGPVGMAIGYGAGRLAGNEARKHVIPMVHKGADKALNMVARHQAKKQLRNGDLGFISGTNPAARPAVGTKNMGLVEDLHARGMNPDPVTGSYGGKLERSYMVEKPDLDSMVGLGQKYGQESVMFSDHGKNSLLNVAPRGGDARAIGDVQPLGPAKVLKKAPTDGSAYSEMTIHGKQIPFTAATNGAPIQAPQGVKTQLLGNYQRQLREKHNGKSPAQLVQNANAGMDWVSKHVKNDFYAKQAMQAILDEPTLTRKIVQGLANGLGVPGLWPEEDEFVGEPRSDEPPNY